MIGDENREHDARDGARSDQIPGMPVPSRWQIPTWYRRIGLASWFFIGTVAAVALLCGLVAATSEIMAPLVMGAFLAIVFYPVVDWLEARRLARGSAALVVLVGLVVLLGVVAWVCASALAEQGDELSASIDNAVIKIRDWLDGTPIPEDVADQVRSTTSDLGPSLVDGLAGRAIDVIDSAFGLITGMILGTIVLYYLMKDGPRMAGDWIGRQQPDSQPLLTRIGDRTVANVQSYIQGRTAMAVVNGAGLGLAALVLGVPAAGAIAVVNFIGSYVPYLGAFIGGAFAVILALGGGGVTEALLMLAITLVVNLLLENLLEPALIGDTMNIHPLLILLATSLGGMVAGMIGLILGAPVLAIAMDIQRELKSAGFFEQD